MECGLTKKQSQMLYGMAILLMLYHHLYCIPDRLHFPYFSMLDSLLGFGTERKVAWFGKICVALFAFITEYAFHVKYSEKNEYLEILCGVLKQCGTLLVKLWLVCMLFIPIGLICGAVSFDIKALCLWFLARSPNGEWWYVSFYIIAMASFPLLDAASRQIKKGLIGRLNHLYPVLVCLLVGVFCYLTGVNKYLLIVTLGYLASDLRVFEGMNRVFEGRYTYAGQWIICGIGLCACVILRILTASHAASHWMDFFIIIPFVFCVTVVLKKARFFSKFLCFLGKYSTYMWLTHTFFIYYFFQKFSMISGHSTVMYVQLIVVSLGTAMFLQFAEKYVYKGLSIAKEKTAGYLARIEYVENRTE